MIPTGLDVPATFVIFGASGDLTKRKLVPALYHLEQVNSFPKGINTVGVARRPWTDEAFQGLMLEGTTRHSRTKSVDPDVWARLSKTMGYVQGTFEDKETYSKLALRLAEQESEGPRTHVFYLAVGPDEILGIVKHLSEAGLLSHDAEKGRRSHVVVEKPFGDDEASAHNLNKELFQYVKEEQLYRIDHYLGKETVQNLAVLRFENMIFEALWNRKHVSHVEITVAEDIGIEGRGKFYEKVGITRDIVQNHLLQLLTLVAMEPPIAFEANALRDEKVKVLKTLRRITKENAKQSVVRAQYTEGIVGNIAVPGYRQEPDVAPNSQTETYVALRVFVDNWRWAGIPFFLRAGKRLARRLAEVVIHFRDPPHPLFPDGVGRSSNILVFSIQPDEGISLRIDTKVPGNTLSIRGVDMEFSYSKGFGGGGPEAYERLILDAIRGDATLFTRHDEVEAQWHFIDPIVTAFRENLIPLVHYSAGSEGPSDSIYLADEVGVAFRPLRLK
ncbi:MAG: glucose-6-phosphate dehydrogenase [Polyangiaceae bacterium]